MKSSMVNIWKDTQKHNDKGQLVARPLGLQKLQPPGGIQTTAQIQLGVCTKNAYTHRNNRSLIQATCN